MPVIVENTITKPRRSAIIAVAAFCQLILVVGMANAQSGTPSPAAGASLQDFLACQKIDKRKARYRCYDALESGEALPPAAASPTAGAAVSAAPVVQDAAQRRRDFGRSVEAKEKKELEVIVVQVVSVTKGGSGKWTFRTSDGQVWRQVNDKYARFRNQSFQAEISKAPFGGFYFRPADQKKMRLRVKRVK